MLRFFVLSQKNWGNNKIKRKNVVSNGKGNSLIMVVILWVVEKLQSLLLWEYTFYSLLSEGRNNLIPSVTPSLTMYSVKIQ